MAAPLSAPRRVSSIASTAMHTHGGRRDLTLGKHRRPTPCRSAVVSPARVEVGGLVVVGGGGSSSDSDETRSGVREAADLTISANTTALAERRFGSVESSSPRLDRALRRSARVGNADRPAYPRRTIGQSVGPRCRAWRSAAVAGAHAEAPLYRLETRLNLAGVSASPVMNVSRPSCRDDRRS
jgi:hypothetical protein